MRTSTALRAAAVAAAVVLPAAARAQNAAINNNPAKLEFGADAGATFGLGKNSYVGISLPTERARVGFFLAGNPRLEVEPAFGLNYFKAKGGDATTIYNVELGVLYHLRAPSYVTGVTGATVAYVRPFVGYQGTAVGGGGADSHATTFGAGVGLKLPVRTNIALRGEANLGYDTNNKAARIGLLAGASFFAFR